MTKPRLSICIATYNRAQYIGETLESIIPQLTDDVEIVIVDGASTDDTRSVVKRYAENCQQIHYTQLPSKGGVDYDYCKAVELAHGEYCWLFTDDDLFKPGAIRTVLNEIGKAYSVIVVNAQGMNSDFSEILDEQRLRINRNEVYSECQMEQLFSRAVSYMSFIGSIVIQRELWMQREKKQYFGTEFIHVGVIFQAALPAPALIIAEPYITVRLGNFQWTPRAVDVWMSQWPNLLFSFTHIPEKIRGRYQMTNPWRRLKVLILCREMGAYSLKEYRRLFAAKEASLGWRFTGRLIALLPVCFVKFFMLPYRKFKERLLRWKITRGKNAINIP